MRRIPFVLGAALLLMSCSLVVSLDGLAGSPAGDAAPGADVAAAETGSTPDAAEDHAVTPFDATAFPGLDASFDGPDAKTFFDDFQRPNADPLGNGWVERFSGAFTIANGTATKQTSINGYRDNIVYRPASEDLADVEVSAEVRFTGSGPVDRPMLWARAQKIAPNKVDGYHVYLDCCTNHFHLARHVGAESTEVAAFDTRALVPNETYRWTLRVTGTVSTAVYARVEARRDTGGWEMLGQTGYVDVDSDRIATPGAAGFSGDVQNGYTFDNFSRTGY
jgi:hypothetical protein